MMSAGILSTKRRTTTFYNFLLTNTPTCEDRELRHEKYLVVKYCTLGRSWCSCLRQLSLRCWWPRWKHTYLKSSERFDPATEAWSSDVAPMSHARFGHGVATLDGFIYAVGGYSGAALGRC
ncbi:hypothetical protein OSTOST_25220 [Ostertagia ostertagi]